MTELRKENSGSDWLFPIFPGESISKKNREQESDPEFSFLNPVGEIFVIRR